MAWTRIDDKFLMNPKIQSAGPYGMALYLSGLIYCNTNVTDGFIPDVMLPVLCGMAYQTASKRVADALVKLNLWERVEGGYQIHDFLSFNKSRDEIESLNKQRANNGAKGGRQANQVAKQTGSDLVSKPVPINPNTLNPNTLNPEKDKETAAAAAFYEANFGVMSSVIMAEIDKAIAETSLDWVLDAMREAVTHDVRKWSYVAKVLATWKGTGRKGVKAVSTPKQNQDDKLEKFRALYGAQKAGA